MRSTSTGTRISVRVMPRSPRTEIGAVRDGRLLVRVTAPPVDDAANGALVRVLAVSLQVPAGRVRLVTGQTSRNKVIDVEGLTPADVRARLNV